MELVLNQATVLLLGWMLVFCCAVLPGVHGDCNPDDCQLEWIDRYEGGVAVSAILFIFYVERVI